MVIDMVGAMEKGLEAARVSSPSVGTYDGIDLKTLPKYICFKAALLKDKITYQYIVMALLGLIVAREVFNKVEVFSLYKQLREKEYILAPGVKDFSPVNPKSVSDTYINEAVTDYLSLLGNVNSNNIEEAYRSLTVAMSPELRLKFELESQEWVAKVIKDNITQVLKVVNKEITSDDQGTYQVKAMVRKEFYSNTEFLNSVDEIIEMELRLVPPDDNKRWYLEIRKLSQNNVEAFKPKKSSGDSNEN